MFSIANSLNRLGIYWARSKDGISQEEAKNLFFKFRQKSVLKPEEPEPVEEGDLSSKMVVFMQDTAEKLDRIESDINYLKKQVDTILKKI